MPLSTRPQIILTSISIRLHLHAILISLKSASLRSVTYKWEAEHTMVAACDMRLKRQDVTSTETADLITAARNLYEKLHKGFIHKGVHRIPIAGDTTKLPYADGLSELEKKLAWAQHYLAQNLPGSQQLRQIMGHAQFGARVLYGDCIFITVSPNEQHSALVLRLSRFRRNDPFVQHSHDHVQEVCARV